MYLRLSKNVSTKKTAVASPLPSEIAEAENFDVWKQIQPVADTNKGKTDFSDVHSHPIENEPVSLDVKFQAALWMCQLFFYIKLLY